MYALKSWVPKPLINGPSSTTQRVELSQLTDNVFVVRVMRALVLLYKDKEKNVNVETDSERKKVGKSKTN